jgi:hypothetical protein
MKFLKSKKFWKRLIIWLIVIPVFLFSLLIGILFWKQDAIVQELITTLNKDFKGQFELKGSHISPFANFPYISIDLEELTLYEDKTKTGTPVIDIHDVYVGFDIWTLITGNFEIKAIKLKDGSINLIQHLDGELNIAKAFATEKEIESAEEEFHLDLKAIDLDHIDINKYNETSKLYLDMYVTDAHTKFKTSDVGVSVFLDSKFEITVVDNGDTTFIKHKHFDVHTKLDFINETQILEIQPSEVALEGAVFNAEGTIDFDDDVNLDLKFNGSKPNFDLFIALAPEEIIPTLKKYDNKGKVYFEAIVKGKSANGHNPLIDATFGCEDAFFSNTTNLKKLDDLQFKGHFTNGEKRNPSTMEFSLMDFSAKPEAGVFSGNLIVKNFDSPEIDLQLISDFQLDFLANFFNLSDLKNLKGGVKLTMNFKDIIDLENPERSIEKLNESYYTELKITDLSFGTDAFHLPLKDLDLYVKMDGHEADIEYCNIKIGKSDINIKGMIDDLPAILHHMDIQVLTHLDITANYLDLYELTDSKAEGNVPFDEQITDLQLGLSFKSSARAFTESPNLPIGEFFIDNLYAKMKHYPHTLHDFHADLLIEDHDFKIIDFNGMIDKSDFHFNGRLNNYNLWFENDPKGDTKIEFLLDSKLLQLEDVFSYGGENFVPEDYRHEEFKNIKIHGYADLHFSKGLKSADVYLDQFDATMKIHPMRFENFKGRVHIEDEHLTLEKFGGKIGKSSFECDLTYYYGENKAIKKKDNKLYLKSSNLDFDQLFNYNPPPPSKTLTPADHEAVFNIYDLPFPEMSFELDIKQLNYHRYMISNFKTKLRTQENHYLYIDTLSMHLAGGDMYMKGYFNGSNPKLIYLNPTVRMKNIDLDKLMFKFENFGQDYLVSENLHGKLNGKIWGKIHMHPDLIPIIDDSEIHMDIDVMSGKLENYGPMEALSDYFKDKNLTKIIFDTLSNHIDMKNGVMTIPKMTVNSSLGFIEISGKQDTNYNMEYYIRIPMKLVTDAGKSKLFGKKEGEVDPEQEDEIIYKDESKKTKYINLKITGDAENYKITLGKDKSGG